MNMPPPPPGSPDESFPEQIPPPGYQAYGQPGSAPGSQSNGKGTAAMVCGIIGLVMLLLCGVFSVVISPVAFFLGRSASKEIEAAPGQYSNAGQAKAGWIMGLIGMILVAIWLVVVVIVVAGSN
ncbi:hypothetical protein [Ilumatobacter nonamiensis]|uniref:hypothetical protein n=1 Tax=Ilumatobacter nonamiensis TaxID=467093 RepID=UPI00034BAFEB|nr:hypothetical protein [Ilumatobacter nonamiensis]